MTYEKRKELERFSMGVVGSGKRSKYLAPDPVSLAEPINLYDIDRLINTIKALVIAFREFEALSKNGEKFDIKVAFETVNRTKEFNKDLFDQFEVIVEQKINVQCKDNNTLEANYKTRMQCEIDGKVYMTEHINEMIEDHGGLDKVGFAMRAPGYIIDYLKLEL